MCPDFTRRDFSMFKPHESHKPHRFEPEGLRVRAPTAFTVPVDTIYCDVIRILQIPAPRAVYTLLQHAFHSGGLVAPSMSLSMPCLVTTSQGASISWKSAAQATNGRHLVRVRVRQHRLYCLGGPYSLPILQNLHHRSNQDIYICAVHHVVVPLLRLRLWCHLHIDCSFQ